MATNQPQIVLQLMNILGVPGNCTSFTLSCAVGCVPEITCSFNVVPKNKQPIEDIKLEDITKRYRLVEITDGGK